jgi:GGDEF domain-containing protein
VALYPDHGTDALELAKYADYAMYQAKACGGDRVQVFDPSMPGVPRFHAR